MIIDKHTIKSNKLLDLMKLCNDCWKRAEMKSTGQLLYDELLIKDDLKNIKNWYIEYKCTKCGGISHTHEVKNTDLIREVLKDNNIITD